MTQDRGFAGASAYRESLRRAGSRERRDWHQGAVGESIVGRMLADAGVRTVHDRRVPGSDANIDHIAVAASGVYVIDAKNYSGRPRVETFGGADPTPRRLFVGRDDHTHLVHAVRRQVRVVEGALNDPSLPVRGILCFVGADWDVINGYLVSGVGVTSPDGVAALLATPGPLGPERVDAVHRLLGQVLDAA
ncbi:nuclease-related domain-containing protein [Pseudolysinimonas yzui]|uniref:NERD domain-containing protein n=1 Tax=Pseudolysinimonas yzui TaxID=2708254 RepID=A0A8J3LZ30_9MICO|nr:nuclease-related domain-containing protein [Pseudolysinimonas yzui]GHF08559.1 hypothetical protein GCM10011600_06760 [Pseudolysinimonas yzui]